MDELRREREAYELVSEMYEKATCTPKGVAQMTRADTGSGYYARAAGILGKTPETAEEVLREFVLLVSCYDRIPPQKALEILRRARNVLEHA